MKLCVLSSGSRNGNCFVVCVGEQKILIDCGISPKAIREKLRALGIEDGGWRAAYLTHQHTDHAQYANEFWKATGIIPSRLPEGLISCPRGEVATIRAFDCPHDDCSSAAYLVTDIISGWSVMVATDLVTMPHEAQQYADRASVVALEADYDPEMLDQYEHYDDKLKARIRESHLSNPAAAGLTFGLRKARHLVAVHLSRVCNTPEKVREAFDVHWLSDVKLTVAWDDPVMVEVGNG